MGEQLFMDIDALNPLRVLHSTERIGLVRHVHTMEPFDSLAGDYAILFAFEWMFYGYRNRNRNQARNRGDKPTTEAYDSEGLEQLLSYNVARVLCTDPCVNGGLLNTPSIAYDYHILGPSFRRLSASSNPFIFTNAAV